MVSGGWRPGAGRPRKIITEVKPKRSVGRPKKTTTEEPMKKLSKEFTELMDNIITAAARENLQAVEFMSREMNNPDLPMQHRIQLAQLLAPYQTPKLDSVKSTKKEDKAAKAGEVIKGARFGQSQPPRLVKQ